MSSPEHVEREHFEESNNKIHNGVLLLAHVDHKWVAHHPKACHPPTQGRPPNIIRMVTHCPNDMVAHHSQGGHRATVE